MSTNLPLYQNNRKWMRTMDLLQWQSHSILGVLIRMKGGGANHSGAVMIFNAFKRWRYMTGESLEGGLRANYISRRLKEYKGKVWWHRVLPEFEQYRQGAGEWLADRIGVKYDYKSLFRNAICHVSADARELFCSEAYFLAWRDGGKVPHLQKIKKAPRPNEVVRVMGIHGPGVRLF